jgi:hypothetical protein
MTLLVEICFRSFEILTLVLGIIGLPLSLLLLFWPDHAKKLSGLFSKSVSVDNSLHYLEKDIPISHFIESHHIVFGITLICSSLFLLSFLFLRLDFDKFATIFFTNRELFVINEIIFHAFALLGKITGIGGVIVGIFLLFNLQGPANLGNSLSRRISTQPLVDKLNAHHGGIDDILLRHHILFSLFGLVASVILVMAASISISQ